MYLCFFFVSKTYQFRMLPFGLATSPLIFTREIKAVVGRVHLSGVQMHTYLDDWSISLSSLQVCQTNDVTIRVHSQLSELPS